MILLTCILIESNELLKSYYLSHSKSNQLAGSPDTQTVDTDKTLLAEFSLSFILTSYPIQVATRQDLSST